MSNMLVTASIVFAILAPPISYIIILKQRFKEMSGK